jgi:predicted membrane protein
MDADRWARKQERRMERMARHRRNRSPASGVVVGGVIVAIGVVLLLDNMGIIRAHDFWRFWPLGLVALGLARMTEARPAALIWGGFIAVVGVLIFLDTLDVILFNFNLIWPLAVILFGISMLWKAIERGKVCEGVGEEVTDSSQVNLFAIFSGGRRRIDSKEFRGCDVLAIFGGFHIDLKNAVIPNGQKAVIDVNAVFGGVEIDIPENWSVTMNGMGFFGGFEDKTMPPRVTDVPPPPELIVTGYAVFGGASVRN